MTPSSRRAVATLVLIVAVGAVVWVVVRNDDEPSVAEIRAGQASADSDEAPVPPDPIPVLGSLDAHRPRWLAEHRCNEPRGGSRRQRARRCPDVDLRVLQLQEHDRGATGHPSRVRRSDRDRRSTRARVLLRGRRGQHHRGCRRSRRRLADRARYRGKLEQKG